MAGWKTGRGWKGTPKQETASASVGGGSSTLSGAYLDPNTVDVTDGSGVAFSKAGDSIQAVVDTMSGSASSNPSTMQAALFWDSKIKAQDILDLAAEVVPTVTVEDAGTITAPVVLIVGWVAVPDGGTPSLANFATYKSRWAAVRIAGSYIQTDAGQDNSGFSWSGGLNLDVTEPTDYRWIAHFNARMYRKLSGQVLFTELRGVVGYPGGGGGQNLESGLNDTLNDNVSSDARIHTFFAIGRTATGGSERTVAIQVDNAVAQRASA